MKKSNSTDPEDSLVYSPLCQRIARDGIEVDIQIYKGSTGGWLLEVVGSLVGSAPAGSGKGEDAEDTLRLI
jgi:hypothetical protein